MSNKIYELRKNKQLTQKELADQFNQYIAENDLDIPPVTYTTLARWEKDEVTPKETSLQALADFFDVSISYLKGYSIFKMNIESLSSLVLSIEHSLSNTSGSSDQIEINTLVIKNIHSLLSAISTIGIEIQTLKNENEQLEKQLDNLQFELSQMKPDSSYEIDR